MSVMKKSPIVVRIPLPKHNKVTKDKTKYSRKAKHKSNEKFQTYSHRG